MGDEEDDGGEEFREPQHETEVTERFLAERLERGYIDPTTVLKGESLKRWKRGEQIGHIKAKEECERNGQKAS